MHLKRTFVISIMLSWASAICLAQTDLVFPWITNQPQFRGRIVINNLNPDPVSITLTATRQEGQEPNTETVGPIQLGPLEQFVSDAGALFTALGEGGGYTVRLTSDASAIEAGFVIFGTNSPSGSSPSQANVVPASQASAILLFNYLPLTDGTISAPVLVNPGTQPAQVTLHAYRAGEGKLNTANVIVNPGFPLASLAGSLFPDAVGSDIYIVAESDQPLLGVAFIFNSPQLEPSMANAVPIGFVPAPNAAEPVSFANQIQPIFNASCGNGLCHLDGSAANGLSLDPDVSYDNIVGVPSTQSDFNWVEPGVPDQSYLYLKLLDPAVANYFGARMPRLRTPLSDAETELIRQWILQGAQRN